MANVQAYGNAIYRSVALPIGDATNAAELILEMQNLQKQLACPLVSAKHVGLNLQAFIINLNYARPKPEDFEAVFINPKLISSKAPLVSGLEEDISLPRLSVSIERPKQIEVCFFDGDLKEQTATFSDLAARLVQQGIDQLNGITLIDRLNTHRQRSVKGHLKRIAERKIETKYSLEWDE
ncbi:MAG: hypothetical protein GC178_12325 [Flavobacteriales bacterium]|nr:hypothetical protein [Flavobacteriales bacterium]